MKTVGTWRVASLAVLALACASSPPIQPVSGPAASSHAPSGPTPSLVGTEPTPIEASTPTGPAALSRQLGSAAPADQDASAGDDPEGEPAANAPNVAAPGMPAVCHARVGVRGIRRSALKRTVDGGLGNWLRGVEVEPRVERGQFRGWLVQRVYEGDPCWADVDLKSGDIVTRVNRRPIERPEQAHAVWSSLREARDIVVDYERAGRPRTLRFDVVDDR